MGHFGDWWSNKSSTVDSMVTIRHLEDEKRDACVNIMSLYNSFKV